MVEYRSEIFKKRSMVGARSLWKATGSYDKTKPIIAIVNSFTQFVPGHVHLKEAGEVLEQAVNDAGGLAKQFNTIGIDDGIAMGHDGMLYSLPSRELIADSIEYSVNAHRADAMVCLTNCDKITPAMLIAAARLNIPAVIVSGGAMEAGKILKNSKEKAIDLVDAMIAGEDKSINDEELEEIENNACPTCGSCSGMFTANSMNCLSEALGMSLPGNGSLLATHKLRKELIIKAGQLIVKNTKKYYDNDDFSVLPRSIMTKKSFKNAMALDIAMGGSTNTILHLLAIAYEAKVDFTLKDIEELSKKVPNLCKVAPSSSYHMEDVHNSGGVMAIMGELARNNLIYTDNPTIHSNNIQEMLKTWDINQPDNKVDEEIKKFYCATRSNMVGKLFYLSCENYLEKPTIDVKNGCVRDFENAYSKDGGLAVLRGNFATEGSIVKTAGVDDSIKQFTGRAMVCESQEEACARILGEAKAGDVIVIRYEGPKGGPGMQEMLYPTSYLYSKKLNTKCALITDGRFSGGSSGLVIGHVSPEAAEGGTIALIEDGDIIKIDITNRSLELVLSDKELELRRQKQNKRGSEAFTPAKERKRKVSKALKIYSKHVKNASLGAVVDF